MKRLFLAILIMAIVFPMSNLSAQSNDGDPHSVIHVSFVPPLSTNGGRAPQYTNDVSLNIIAGISKNERVFSAAGVGNIVLNDANGFQTAGAFNAIGGGGRGMLSSGAVNLVRGDYTGAQFAGAVNFSRDMPSGAQFAGAVNLARDLRGAQFSGAINVARDVDGAQIAGAVNVARDVRGVQIGVVNVARSNDYPIGLVNIIRDGEMAVGFGYNDIGTASVNFRSGGRVLYGILGMGYNHRAMDDGAFALTGGMGAHINVAPWMRIKNEITHESIWNGNSWRANNHLYTSKSGYALMPAFRFGRFEVFGGPSINYMRTNDADMYDLFPKNSLWEKKRDVGRRYSPSLQQIFIGWQVGVQFVIW
jgi:hypothetical protein